MNVWKENNALWNEKPMIQREQNSKWRCCSPYQSLAWAALDNAVHFRTWLACWLSHNLKTLTEEIFSFRIWHKICNIPEAAMQIWKLPTRSTDELISKIFSDRQHRKIEHLPIPTHQHHFTGLKMSHFSPDFFKSNAFRICILFFYSQILVSIRIEILNLFFMFHIRHISI